MRLTTPLLLVMLVVSGCKPTTPAEQMQRDFDARNAARADSLETLVGSATSSNIDDIKRQAATEAATQYEIVARSGSATDRCVQSMVVTAAYLQASDAAAYDRWKATERADCAAAGMPQ